MTTIECVDDTRSLLGESAVWDVADGLLYWADIDGGLLHRYDPAAGRGLAPHDVGEKVAAIAVREAGGLVIGTESGIYTYDFDTKARVKIADPEADRPDNRFNDCVTDRQGRWWLGSFGMMRPQRAEAAFWRFNPDHSVTRWLDGVYTTNGLAFSPDGSTMYLSDSHPDVRTIWACDYDIDTGMPTDRRVFFDTREVAGRPDGGTVDADGCYWMAGVGGWQLVRLTPRGEIDMIIDMPVERPSKPMFGGPDLATLFVTSIGIGQTEGTEQPQAGSLFAVTGLPVGGVPAARFAG
ncbi:SMP-30/gluconolactonase/LRE family protein [Acuticoccus sp. M5D2P5]|uniref:SMP-30/gluconolactonase/LRE family protein n=1 Tax=Acuticoccus kalidii TaxID=2910977 RepID=UPI001F45AA01|nr:SMP-30/gluconolactonase/LRE family protein [Acuticoccus kalidii]MCF3935615.1 SMP-30/gluconolactonase/LRE family protein [Acuticoccus kalidii]